MNTTICRTAASPGLNRYFERSFLSSQLGESLRQELARGHYFNRPVSVVAVRPTSRDPRIANPRAALHKLSSDCKKTLRTIDHGGLHQDTVVYILPNTDGPGAKTALKRISRNFHNSLAPDQKDLFGLEASVQAANEPGSSLERELVRGLSRFGPASQVP